MTRLAGMWAAAAAAIATRTTQQQQQSIAACSRCLSSGHAAWAQHQQQQQGPSSSSSEQTDEASIPVHELTREYAYDDEGQAGNRLKFVSRERRLVPRPPFYRPPIYFPEVTLQMLKLTEQQKQQIQDTGWTREVAFKTTPNVTKLEIKGILESVYGMRVERVHTINYLGRKFVTYSAQKRPKRLLWRADDWKKAYVIFRAPEGLQLPEEEARAPRPPMLQQLLASKGLLKGEQPPPQQQQPTSTEPGLTSMDASSPQASSTDVASQSTMKLP